MRLAVLRCKLCCNRLTAVSARDYDADGDGDDDNNDDSGYQRSSIGQRPQTGRLVSSLCALPEPVHSCLVPHTTIILAPCSGHIMCLPKGLHHAAVRRARDLSDELSRNSHGCNNKNKSESKNPSNNNNNNKQQQQQRRRQQAAAAAASRTPTSEPKAQSPLTHSIRQSPPHRNWVLNPKFETLLSPKPDTR